MRKAVIRTILIAACALGVLLPAGAARSQQESLMGADFGCGVVVYDSEVVSGPIAELLSKAGVNPAFDQIFFYRDGTAVSPSEVRRLFGRGDIVRMEVTRKGDEVQVNWMTSGQPSSFPVHYRTAFQQPGGRSSRCAWCRALWERLTGIPVFAQTIFSGPGFIPHVLLEVRLTGPGRVTAVVVTGSREITLPAGAAAASGDRISVTLPFAAAASWGILQPGVRIISGAVARPDAPDGVFDRVPNRDAFQVGVTGYGAIDPQGVIEKFDVTGDGKDDLYYLDTNGNGVIDAVGIDRNGDGQLSFQMGEGPFLLINSSGRPHEFAGVAHEVEGRRHSFFLRNAQVAYLTIVEDRNGDRRIQSDELQSSFVALR